MSSHDLVACEGLDGPHKDTLYRAVRNVLATDIALQVLAQVIDGLPTIETYTDTYRPLRFAADHPIRKHSDVCPAAVDAAEKLRAEFDPDSLRFQSTLLDAFGAAAPASRAFNIRLIELVAVSVHQIAAFLFQKDMCLHDPATTDGMDAKTVTRIGEADCLLGKHQAKPPQMTLLFLPGFRRWDAYPAGVADVVGYWAEDRILGGVVLFNRSMDWTKQEEQREPNVYLDSWHCDVAFRISQLRNSQQDALLRFILSSSSPDTCPLPVLTTRKNTNFIAMHDAIPVYHVYRDPWERFVLPADVNAGKRPRDCVLVPDAPDFRDTDDESA